MTLKPILAHLIRVELLVALPIGKKESHSLGEAPRSGKIQDETGCDCVNPVVASWWWARQLGGMSMLPCVSYLSSLYPSDAKLISDATNQAFTRIGVATTGKI